MVEIVYNNMKPNPSKRFGFLTVIRKNYNRPDLQYMAEIVYNNMKPLCMTYD